MKIIIIGDGKVGYKLARQLSTEKYDVVLIDSEIIWILRAWREMVRTQKF